MWRALWRLCPSRALSSRLLRLPSSHVLWDERLPGQRNGMPDVVVEFDTVTLDLPGGTTLCGQIVLIGAVTFWQTPLSVRVFLWLLSCVLSRRRATTVANVITAKTLLRSYLHVFPP